MAQYKEGYKEKKLRISKLGHAFIGKDIIDPKIKPLIIQNLIPKWWFSYESTKFSIYFNLNMTTHCIVCQCPVGIAHHAWCINMSFPFYFEHWFQLCAKLSAVINKFQWISFACYFNYGSILPCIKYVDSSGIKYIIYKYMRTNVSSTYLHINWYI